MRLWRCLPVAVLLSAWVPVAGAQEAQVPVMERGAVSGAPQRLGFFQELNADCSADGLPAIHIAQPPQHGRLQAVAVLGHSNFLPGNQRFACNLRPLPGTALVYTSDRGFQGVDALVVSVINPNGLREVLRYVVSVEQANTVAVPHGNWVHV